MRRRITASLVILLAAVAALPPAPALPLADEAPPFATPPRDLLDAALASPDAVGAAFALVRAAHGLDAPPAPPPRPLRVADAVLALYAAADLDPPDAAARARLVADADALPPTWAGGVALVLVAMAEAVELSRLGLAGEVAGAERVAAALAAVAPVLAEATTEPGVRFEDPYGYVRVDTGATDDVHARPVWLRVDGGGDDLYVGAHAGAGSTLPRVPIAVVLDLAGDDEYLYHAEGRVASAAQGGAAGGGIGILFDAAGADRYVARQAPGVLHGAGFQGGCWAGGVGVLVDAAGNDTYEAAFHHQGGAQGGATACVALHLDLRGNDRFDATSTGFASQGAAALGGVGLLVNRFGDDVYVSSSLVHQGDGEVGLGILLDHLGQDVYNGDASRNGRHRAQGRAGVLYDSSYTPQSDGRVVYLHQVRDDDGDGHPALWFRQRDVHLNPDGTPGYSRDEPFMLPDGRRHAGDPDDRERLRAVDLVGPPRCVVAVLDTGVNPYHREFRAAWPRDPASWIPDFPAGAVPLDLALGAPSYAEARAADAALWASLERGVVYTVPGTRVVAAVSLGDVGSPFVGATRVLDDSPTGHGTSTAGAAAGATTGLGPGCGLAIVEAGDVREALRWVARQPWVDVVSLSIGTRAGVYLPSDVANLTREVARSGKLVVVAAGNGLSGADVPDPTPAPWSPYAGPGWVLTVGASSPWNDMPVWWGAYPVDALSLGVDVKVPGASTMVDHARFGGSSAAAPRVAGALGHVLAAARAAADAPTRPEAGPLADGALTLAEWQQAVLATARVANVTTVARACLADGLERCVLQEKRWLYLVPSVDGAEWTTAGYGIVDAASRDRAARVVAGLEPAPERAAEDRWWRAVHAARETFWAAHDDRGLLVQV